MRIRIFTFYGILALGVSCATPPTSRYPPVDLTVMGEETTSELAARLSAELTELTPVAFRSKDGVVSGTVLASGPVEASKAMRGYMVSVGLGTAEPLLCTVQEGVLGLSAFARSLAQAFVASYETHEFKYVFAGTNGSLPYLVVHGQYIDRGDDGGDRRTGFLKLVVVGRAELTVACFHDQFGYRETVERVALSLIEALDWERDMPLQPLVRRSVYALREDGRAAGAREVVIRADEEDFRRSWIRTAFLTLRGPQRLFARDVVETYDSDPDGRVYAQTYQVRENGELQAELTLEEKPPSDYEVSGHVNQEATETRFTAPEGIPDLLRMASYRKKQTSFERFMPELSARAPTQSQVRREGRALRIESGDRVLRGQLDEKGDWVSGQWSNGYSFERTALER